MLTDGGLETTLVFHDNIELPHFAGELENDPEWIKRIGGIRANASCKSHAELDETTELDAVDKKELADWYKRLKTVLPNLKVYGGCCGTDHSYIETIYEYAMP